MISGAAKLAKAKLLLKMNKLPKSLANYITLTVDAPCMKGKGCVSFFKYDYFSTNSAAAEGYAFVEAGNQKGPRDGPSISLLFRVKSRFRPHMVTFYIQTQYPQTLTFEMSPSPRQTMEAKGKLAASVVVVPAQLTQRIYLMGSKGLRFTAVDIDVIN